MTTWAPYDEPEFEDIFEYFHHADGTRAKANSGAPSVLVAYGQADADALAVADLPGTYVQLTREDDQ